METDNGLVQRLALAAMQAWADDELRSLNAQIEYVLREALIKSGRLKRPPSNPEIREPEAS
ncbi:MAG: Arc family DNA binding domain-containing protein [Gammaproteobacteria bacterium]|nr:Arc family DNA binding domain-containing protein [Gammaproteobacteria bacterium]